MNRIGSKVIEVPEEITVTKDGGNTTVGGPKGELTRYFDPRITFEQEGGEAHFSHSSEANKALHGTERTNLVSMIGGTTDGYVKKLTLANIGYRAAAQDEKSALDVGYSHPVVPETPEDVIARTPSATSIKVEGVSKQIAGRSAAEVRDVRSPKPYKGKGIRYGDEYVRRKGSKTGK